MDNVKEFHLYLDVSYPNDNTLHSFEDNTYHAGHSMRNFFV